MATPLMGDGFRVRLARPDEFEAVRAVRRRAYAALLAQSGADELMADEADARSHSGSYLLVTPEGEAAGTIRACVHSIHFAWPTLPLNHHHPEEMQRIVERRQAVVQSSLLGVVPEYRHLGVLPTLLLLRAVFAAGVAFGADRFLTLVDARPSKSKFWGRLGWQVIGPPVPHRFSERGAVLLEGTISESLRIASTLPEFRVLADLNPPAIERDRFPRQI